MFGAPTMTFCAHTSTLRIRGGPFLQAIVLILDRLTRANYQIPFSSCAIASYTISASYSDVLIIVDTAHVCLHYHGASDSQFGTQPENSLPIRNTALTRALNPGL